MLRVSGALLALLGLVAATEIGITANGRAEALLDGCEVDGVPLPCAAAEFSTGFAAVTTPVHWAEPRTACAPSKKFIYGAGVVVQRGDCPFAEKLRHLSERGEPSAVFVVNSVPGDPVPIGDDGTRYPFPVFMVPQDAALRSGSVVSAPALPSSSSSSSIPSLNHDCVRHFVGESAGLGSELLALAGSAVVAELHGVPFEADWGRWQALSASAAPSAAPSELECLPVRDGRGDRRDPGWALVRRLLLAEAQRDPEGVRRALARALERLIGRPSDTLTPLCAAVHVRRGDKAAEEEPVPLQTYLEALPSPSAGCDSLFVASDSADAIEELSAAASARGWAPTARSLAYRPAEGHSERGFNALSSEEQLRRAQDFLSEVDEVARAGAAVVTFSSNVGLLVALRSADPEAVVSVQGRWVPFL